MTGGEGGDDRGHRGDLLVGRLPSDQHEGRLVTELVAELVLELVLELVTELVTGPVTGLVTGLVAGHSGMFPCFLGGSVARLVRSSRSARTISERVSCGVITAST